MTMNKSARPSLYSGTSSTNTAEVFTILGGLESPRRSGGLIKRAALILLAICVSAGAFIVVNNFSDLRSRAMVLVDSVLSRDVAIGQTTAAAATPASAVAKPQDAQVSVAKIVSEPVEQQTPSSLDQTANIGLPVPSPLPELAAKSIMNSGSLPSTVAVNGSSDAQSTVPQSAAETSVNKAASAEKVRAEQPARQATAKPRQSRQPHHAATRHKDDRDVDLIAALLTRVSAADTAEKSSKGADAPKARNAPVIQKSSSAAGGSEKPKRDLALTQVHESLTASVRRCRTLGLVEGELCRLRICSGHWGNDPACPSSGLPPGN